MSQSNIIREIAGHPRCVPYPMDCEDWVSEYLWNDLRDRCVFQLGKGSHLASGIGKTFNGIENKYFSNSNVTGTDYISAAFELMHGQNRFRLLTSGFLGVQFGGGFVFPTVYTTSIAFKVFNRTMGTEAVICQIFFNKSQWDAANSTPPAFPNYVTPAVVAPYIVDLNTQVIPATFDLSFEQEWPANIYPLPGTTDACELRVIFNALDGLIPYGPMIVNHFHLSQILEP